MNLQPSKKPIYLQFMFFVHLNTQAQIKAVPICQPELNPKTGIKKRYPDFKGLNQLQPFWADVHHYTFGRL
jgi:hypothetical protein